MGGAAWERLLFRHVLSHCISVSLYWQNNYSGQRVIYNCPPATGLLREDIGVSTAVLTTHTSTHAAAASLLTACRILSDISPGSGLFFFSKEVTGVEGKKNTAPTTVSPHLI